MYRGEWVLFCFLLWDNRGVSLFELNGCCLLICIDSFVYFLIEMI
jgi:hypothetical protein